MADASVTLSGLIGLGLGRPKEWLVPPALAPSAGTRTLLVAAGAALVVHAAECSRWFYTVVAITREVYKKW
ncbi:hypothetical protein SPI_05535 [Niveomyces insectorum RCEF 264]|uniref:Uncharacterized protein n=1 Tax=Niveomyces insectorum RCEF 264 TaxID=1081102 RepID=A0A167TB66_9HYPO|nr:hypothetical protein SPI_05535 [Niveomyces insectorum RCEF 264]